MKQFLRRYLFLRKEVYTNNAKTNISRGQDSSTNIIRKVDSVDGFNVGDIITVKVHRASGIIESVTTNTGRFTLGSLKKNHMGGKETPVRQMSSSREYKIMITIKIFSYSLKSLVGISSWSEPIESLAHPAGFKKHSDLLVPSVGSVGVGSTVSAKDQNYIFYRSYR